MSHIIGLLAEDFKKIRVVSITPTGRVVQITGPNGQGKTSVLDAIWFALVGKKAAPVKPVRRGSQRAKIKLDIGEFVITRTITPNDYQTLTVETAAGSKVAHPQGVLDGLLGELTFDPLKFVNMEAPKQVELLRKVAKVELNIEEIDAANQRDYDTRTAVNAETARLTTQVNEITIQAGLPEAKLDEAAALDAITQANAKNRQADEVRRTRMQLGAAVGTKRAGLAEHDQLMERTKKRIEDLKADLEREQKTLKAAEKSRPTMAAALEEAEKAHAEAPEGELIDIDRLTAELQRVQLVNRELDKRERRQRLEQQLTESKNRSDELTRAIKRRQEQKVEAVQKAEMPVAGLAFDEDLKLVTMNGIPLDQLGEAEQLRISTRIAMAANPTLRILRIDRGEALDEGNLALLAAMAEEHDYQIWMAKVDTSGKVGIVLEDGMVKPAEEQ